MIGSTKQFGAVAGIKKYSNPISIARKIMELSPHVFLIAEGAENFAKSVGFVEAAILSEEMKRRYEQIMEGKSSQLIGDPDPIIRLAKKYNSNIKEKLENFPYKDWYNKLSYKYHGTVNVLAKDNDGEIVGGVSTSGLALKFPGRVGDTPIIGAGLYVNKDAAVACVGTGEITMRLCTAKTTIDELKNFQTSEVLKRRILEAKMLGDKGIIQILVLKSNGEVQAATNASVGEHLHVYLMTELDQEPKKIRTTIY